MMTPLLMLVLLTFTNALQAHEAGVTDTSIQVGHSTLKLVYTRPQKGLDTLPRQAGVSLAQTISQGFAVKNDGQLCETSPVQQRALSHINAVQFSWQLDCKRPLKSLGIEYEVFHQDDKHDNFVRLFIAGRQQNFTFNQKYRFHNLSVDYLLKLWGKAVPAQAMSDKAGRDVTASQDENNDDQSGWLKAQQSSHYFTVGLQHILQGYDHVLFILGLLMLPLRFRPLCMLVSTFTLAHSMTLGLAVFNVVRLPSVFVEVAIAGSIIYVALENYWQLNNKLSKDKWPSVWRRRLIMTFLFGLIHGFGFSYILNEIGLGDQISAALMFFNLGVECGQLMVVACIFPLMALAFKYPKGFVLARFGSLMIVAMGSMWLLERLP